MPKVRSARTCRKCARSTVRARSPHVSARVNTSTRARSACLHNGSEAMGHTVAQIGAIPTCSRAKYQNPDRRNLRQPCGRPSEQCARETRGVSRTHPFGRKRQHAPPNPTGHKQAKVTVGPKKADRSLTPLMRMTKDRDLKPRGRYLAGPSPLPDDCVLVETHRTDGKTDKVAHGTNRKARDSCRRRVDVTQASVGRANPR